MKPSPASLHSFKLLGALALRITLRRWRLQKLKTLALLSIVALGVSVFLSIGLTNRAAVNSFRSFTELVAGKSQFTLRSASGHLSFDDAARARRALLDTEASLFPTSELIAASAQSDPSQPPPLYKLIGIDLIAAASHLAKIGEAAPSATESGEETPNIFDHLSQANAFFAPQDLASREDWAPGDDVSFFLGHSPTLLHYVGPIPNQTSSADQNLPALVMDVFALASIADRPDELDTIEVILPPNRLDPISLSKVEKLLQSSNPGHWIVETQSGRQQSGAIMTLALRSNLRALSAMSLIVALLLVFQALDSSVSRRRGEIAALRSLGVSPFLIRSLWLIEAVLIGACGGALGIALGLATARFSAAMVNDTVNALYYFTHGSELNYEAGEIAIAWILAIVACLIAGWFPARVAAKTPPAQLLKQKSQTDGYNRAPYLMISIGGALIALLAYFIPPIPAANGHGIPIGGYLLALAATAAVVLVACLCLELLPRAASKWIKSSVPAKVGLSRLRSPVTRHRLALGSVIVAVGMTAAMMLLIGSFEKTVTAWMSKVIQADVYLRSRAATSAQSGNQIGPELWRQFLNDPRIKDGGTISQFDLRIQNQDTFIIGLDSGYLQREPHIAWIGPTPDLAKMEDGRAAIINESFSQRFDLGIGDTLEIETPAGTKTLMIIGLQSDFGNERGSIGVQGSHLASWMGHERVRGVAIHLKPDTDLRQYVESIQREHPGLEVFSNRLLRAQALQVFRQTFAITYALELIGLFISVSGLGAMLFSSLLERRGEIGALKRIGLSRKELSLAATFEGLGISGLGILWGISLGLIQGWTLIFIVNKQSFGWTLSISIPWIQFSLLAAAVLSAGAFISWRVGKWSSGLPPEQEE